MARRMAKWGKIVWWPDRVDIGYKAMLIRADASPREEIWRFIKTLVSIFLTKYRAWAYEREDMEELINYKYSEKYILNSTESHFVKNTSKKKYNEYFYIFRK